MTTTLHRQGPVEAREGHAVELVGQLGCRAGPFCLGEGIHDGAAAACVAGVVVGQSFLDLAVLEEADIVTPHLATKGIARYELAEWLTGHHHHLVCVECGQVDDVVVPPGIESQVDRIVNDIAAQAAFTAIGHALEIEGRCARCT